MQPTMLVGPEPGQPDGWLCHECQSIWKNQDQRAQRNMIADLKRVAGKSCYKIAADIIDEHAINLWVLAEREGWL